MLLAEAAERLGPKALEPGHYHESNWTTDQWTRGCFTGFLTPGATSLFASAVRDPVGPIHWAGTETSTHWPSFIDGAIRSGEREAEAIKNDAWLAVSAGVPLSSTLSRCPTTPKDFSLVYRGKRADRRMRMSRYILALAAVLCAAPRLRQQNELTETQAFCA